MLLTSWMRKGTHLRHAKSLRGIGAVEMPHGLTRRSLTDDNQMETKANGSKMVQHVLDGKVPLKEMTNVKGWVKSVRRHKKMSFVQIGDGSGLETLQTVIPTKLLPNEITTGASVEVNGQVAEGRNGVIEIFSEDMQVIGDCDSLTYPLQKKYHRPQFLREILHLRPRSSKIGSILRIRNEAMMEIHNFFQNQEFVNIHTPILTSIDCEGAGEMFGVFDPNENSSNNENKKNNQTTEAKEENNNELDNAAVANKYLTVSGQLHAEIFATAVSKVYTFGPAFRAENSNTSRHLSEFYMVEPEVAFHTMEESMDLAENCIKTVTKKVLEKRQSEIKYLFSKAQEELEDNSQPPGLKDENQREISIDDLYTIKDEPFERITYDEAIHILEQENKKERKFMLKPFWGVDMQTEHERFLCEEYFDRKPVFVTNYPKQLKPFYMKVCSEDPETVQCFDLLVPSVGELIGGSEREDDYEKLLQQMQAHSVPEKDLWWYLELRRYGTVPHSGWGMGFERFLQLLSGTSNIRDVIPIPRSPGSFQL